MIRSIIWNASDDLPPSAGEGAIPYYEEAR